MAWMDCFMYWLDSPMEDKNLERKREIFTSNC